MAGSDGVISDPGWVRRWRLNACAGAGGHRGPAVPPLERALPGGLTCEALCTFPRWELGGLRFDSLFRLETSHLFAG